MYFRNDELLSTIQPGWKQVFNTPFTLSVGQKEIIKMKNNEVITDRDLEIARFLFKFRFATLEQVLQYLNYHEAPDAQTSMPALKNRLDKLIQYKVLNKFMLTSDATLEKIAPDAMEIYCMDLGGRYLLAHYSNEDTTDWYTVINMKSSENVSRNLTITGFYLSLLNSAGVNIEYFNVEPEMRVQRKVVIPSFEIAYNVNGIRTYFLGEVVKDYDFPVQFRDKAQKLSLLLESDAWKKYCMNALEAPVLFLIADSDQLAGEVARFMSEATEITRFRLTTDERMQRNLSDKGAFLKYNADKEALVELVAKTFEV